MYISPKIIYLVRKIICTSYLKCRRSCDYKLHDKIKRAITPSKMIS
jgi:hypothetical protein